MTPSPTAMASITARDRASIASAAAALPSVPYNTARLHAGLSPASSRARDHIFGYASTGNSIAAFARAATTFHRGGSSGLTRKSPRERCIHPATACVGSPAAALFVSTADHDVAANNASSSAHATTPATAPHRVGDVRSPERPAAPYELTRARAIKLRSNSAKR